MIDIAYIRANADIVKKAAADKQISVDIDKLLSLDSALRDVMRRIDDLRAKRNRIAKGIPPNSAKDNPAASRAREIKNTLAVLVSEARDIRFAFDELMLRVPSVPAPDVPIGKDENDNVELRRVGSPPPAQQTPLDHVALCEMRDWLDVPRAVKMAGSRAYYLKNELVLLEMAVCRLVVDMLTARGFTPISVPQLVKESAMRGTGYFPIGYDQAYKLPEDDLFLIGTSEVPLVSQHTDEILSLSALPLRYAGISTCYRREAGTYGKDTRGLYRVHQFQKVEQVVFCEADLEMAEKMHYEILANAEAILQALELPYRVCLACTGEIGIGQIRKHEVETWMPSRSAYCETHSCSTMGDFQARRCNIRYRDKNGETRHVFTLNNTGIASPRILIPLLENHQQAEGHIHIPAALRPYMGGRLVL